MGIWRVTGSTRFQNLAVKSITIFHSTSRAPDVRGNVDHITLDYPSQYLTNLRTQFQYLFSSAPPSSASSTCFASATSCPRRQVQVTLTLPCLEVPLMRDDEYDYGDGRAEG
eukprot:49609-Pelagomonas_calceolata.AAC.1